MEELILTRGYDRMTSCVGSLMMPLQRLSGARNTPRAVVWRPRVFENHSTECAIFLLHFKSKYYLKACDVGTRARVRMNLSVSLILSYTITNSYWHDIRLKDGRQFALRLHRSTELDHFIESLRGAMKDGLTEVRGREGDQALRDIHVGPPINTAEASQRTLSETLVGEQGLPTRHLHPVATSTAILDSTRYRNRPQPPLPDVELESAMRPPTTTHDLSATIVDSIRTFSVPNYWGPRSELSEDELNLLTDESLMLEEAIQRGDEDEAAHWAALLARRKSDVVVTYVSTMEDPLSYRRLAPYKPAPRPPPAVPRCTNGYLCMDKKPQSPESYYEPVELSVTDDGRPPSPESYFEPIVVSVHSDDRSPARHITGQAAGRASVDRSPSPARPLPSLPRGVEQGAGRVKAAGRSPSPAQPLPRSPLSVERPKAADRSPSGIDRSPSPARPLPRSPLSVEHGGERVKAANIDRSPSPARPLPRSPLSVEQGAGPMRPGGRSPSGIDRSPSPARPLPRSPLSMEQGGERVKAPGRSPTSSWACWTCSATNPAHATCCVICNAPKQ